MAVPEIDVKEAMRLLEEEMKDDTGIATPRDLMDDFQTVKEMWEEAKNRELSGTCFEMAGQLGYEWKAIMGMKLDKERTGKWVWKEGNWARKMDDKAIKARIKKMQAELKRLQEEEDATPRPVPRARNICTWVAKDSEKDVWCCNNEVLRHPETREMLYFCGYHVKHCVYLHPGDQVAIEIPNEHGACVTHYISKTEEPPEEYDSRFDIPGTVVQRFNLKGIGLPTHPLAPYLDDEKPKPKRRTVPSVSDWGDYTLIEKAEALWEKMINHFVWQLTGDKEIRRRQYRGASALQSVVRGHQVRTYMKRVKRMREIHRRNKAATVIQIPYRARLLRKAQDRNLALVKRAVKFIEERMAEKYMWRAIRAKLRQHEAARCIQKFIRQMIAQFRWGIIRAKIKARRFARLRRRMGALLVRIARGFLGRLRFRRYKAEWIRRDKAARKIQRLGRVVVAKQVFERVRFERVMQKNHGWAALLIQSVVRGFMARQYVKFMKYKRPLAAAKIQGLIRIVWAKQIARKKRRAGERFWEWLGPTLPKSTFKHLTYRVPYEQLFDLSRFMKPKVEVKKKRGLLEYYDSDAQVASWDEEKAALMKACDRLEQEFDKRDRSGDTVVMRVAFKEVLVASGLGLSDKSIFKLQNLFLDDHTGKVDYGMFLRWARMQPGLCSRHRALICPLCFYAGYCRKCRNCTRYKEVPSNKVTSAQGIYKIAICGCGHHRSSHAMMKSNRGTVIFEGERGSSVHAIKMKRILSQKRPVVNMEAEAGRLASTTRIPYTEAAIEGPLGDPMPVQSLSELRSFKGAREAEALHRVTKLSAMTMAASGSRLPEYPNVYEDPEEGVKDSEFERVYNTAGHHYVDLTQEDGRGRKYYKEEDERRPERITGDRITRHTDRLQNKEARILAGYPAHAKEGRQVALEEAKYVEKVVTELEGLTAHKASLEEYRYKFGITRPVPVISNGSLRLSTKPVEIYIHLLKRLAMPAPTWSQEADILVDHENLMSLIFNHSSFLERHWRKLLHDIRVGEVDENLPLPHAAREQLQSLLKPRPERAEHLEEVFRALGYHARTAELDRLGIQRSSGAVNLEQLLHEKVVPKEDLSDKRLALFPRPMRYKPDEDEPALSEGGLDVLHSARGRSRRRRKRRIASRPASRDSQLGISMRQTLQSTLPAADSGRLGATMPPVVEATHRSPMRGDASPTRSLRRVETSRTPMGRSRSQGKREAHSREGILPDEDPRMGHRRNSLPQLTLGGRRLSFELGNAAPIAAPTFTSPMSSLKYQTTGDFDMAHATLNKHKPLDQTGNKSVSFADAEAPRQKTTTGKFRRRRRLSVDMSAGAMLALDQIATSYKNLHTQPRPRLGDIPKMEHARRPFLCPHPGCGRSYAAESTLRFHFRNQHENRQRLATQLPGVDYAMSSYWPSDNPWRSDGPLAPFIPIEVTDGCLYECKICQQRFMKGFHLRNHYMTIHKKNTYVESIRAITTALPQQGIRWGGEAVRCPPEPMPANVVMPTCPRHQWIMPDPACNMCLQLRYQPLPHPPVLFYPTLSVDVLLHLPESQVAANVVAGHPTLCGLVVTPVTDQPDEDGILPKPFPFRVHALCHDNENNNWLWGNRMWTLDHVERTDYGWIPKYGFDRKHEVLEGLTLEWIPAEALIGVCHVERVSAAVFGNMQEAEDLPTHIPCYYTREVAPQDLEDIVAHGAFLTDTNAASMPSPTKFQRSKRTLLGSHSDTLVIANRLEATAKGAQSQSGSVAGSSIGGRITKLAVTKSVASPARTARSAKGGLGSSRHGNGSRRSRTPKTRSPGAPGAAPGGGRLGQTGRESTLKLPVMGPGSLSMYTQ